MELYCDSLIERSKNVYRDKEYNYITSPRNEFIFSWFIINKFKLKIKEEFLYSKLFGCFKPADPIIYGDYIETEIEILAKYLNESKCDKITMFLNMEKEGNKHCNLFIYDKTKNVITIYEPHGSLSYYKEMIEKFIHELRDLLPKFTYIDSTELHQSFQKEEHNREGFQSIERLKVGHCSVWCTFIRNMIYQFPDVDLKDILWNIYTKYVLDNENKVENMENLIKGFFNEISEETKLIVNIDKLYEIQNILKDQNHELYEYADHYFDQERYNISEKICNTLKSQISTEV